METFVHIEFFCFKHIEELLVASEVWLYETKKKIEKLKR